MVKLTAGREGSRGVALHERIAGQVVDAAVVDQVQAERAVARDAADT